MELTFYCSACCLCLKTSAKVDGGHNRDPMDRYVAQIADAQSAVPRLLSEGISRRPATTNVMELGRCSRNSPFLWYQNLTTIGYIKSIDAPSIRTHRRYV